MRGKQSLDRIEAFLWISGIASTENLLLSLSFLQLAYFRDLFVLPQNRSRRLTTEDRFGSEAVIGQFDDSWSLTDFPEGLEVVCRLSHSEL